MITCGEYSDFGVYGTYRAMKDFDFDAELTEYLKTHPPGYDPECFDRDKFLEFLRDSGMTSELDMLTLHLQDYGTPCPHPEKTARAYRIKP